jgi:hypothetical protein
MFWADSSCLTEILFNIFPILPVSQPLVITAVLSNSMI